MDDKQKQGAQSTYVKDIGDIDPSPLTTQLVLREISSLKELLLVHVDRIDKAVIIAHEDLVRLPTDVEKAVSNLKELHQVKFDGVYTMFKEFAELRNEKFAGMQKQMDMQEKLVTQQYNFLVASNDKSDLSFTKMIDQQGQLILNTTKSSDDKIDDLKGRFGKIENLLTASLSEGTGKSQGYKNVGANIGTIISIITLIIVLISFALKFSDKSV